MKILLTGAAGFIGSHITRELIKAGCEIFAFEHPDAKLWRIEDILNRITLIQKDLFSSSDPLDAIGAWRPDACIHLAWYAEPGKYLNSQLNIDALEASLRLFRGLIEKGCKQVVMAGTCAEYDTDQGYLSENSVTRPTTIYAATKLSLYLIGRQLADAAGINFAWARIFYLYGPYEDKRRMIPALINELLHENAFQATKGEQVRDYMHVEDIACAFCTLVLKKAVGLYNICSGMPISVRQMMEMTGDIIGKKELIKFGALPYREWEPPCIFGDNHRLRKLGWNPQYTLEEGLKQVIEWWREKHKVSIK